MDSSFIIPFVKSIARVFETMLQTQVQVGKPFRKPTGEPRYDVSGIIGMSGDVEGSVVLSFPTTVAVETVQRFTGMALPVEHEDFADAVGELVNMVSGNAKAEFTGRKVSISCPSVIVGRNHLVFGSKDVVCISIPCKVEFGQFVVEVGLKGNMLNSAEADRQVAAASA